MSESRTALMPYVYLRPQNRLRPPTRVEAAALEDFRNLIAHLSTYNIPVSAEQELTIALRSHVAGWKARLGLDVIPPREGELKRGRRVGVHAGQRGPRPAEGEGKDAATDAVVADDVSGDADEVLDAEAEAAAGLSPGTRRRVLRLSAEGETDEAVAATLELELAAVRAVLGARARVARMAHEGMADVDIATALDLPIEEVRVVMADVRMRWRP